MINTKTFLALSVVSTVVLCKLVSLIAFNHELKGLIMEGDVKNLLL
jgi:hypothetical protein